MTHTRHFRPYIIAFTVIALASTYFFFQDVIKANWPAWIIAPALVAGYHGALKIARSNGIARVVLYQVALLGVPFMALYSILDEFMRADWLERVALPIVIVAVWLAGTTTFASYAAEEDN